MSDLVEIYDNARKAFGANVSRTPDQEEAHRAALNAVGNAASLNANRVIWERLDAANGLIARLRGHHIQDSNLLERTEIGTESEAEEVAYRIVRAVRSLAPSQLEDGFGVRFAAQEVRVFGEKVAKCATASVVDKVIKSMNIS